MKNKVVVQQRRSATAGQVNAIGQIYRLRLHVNELNAKTTTNISDIVVTISFIFLARGN
jgi:hypothetical protein